MKLTNAPELTEFTKKQDAPKPITYPEAAYLKGIGKSIDEKVSFAIINGQPVIHIRDFEFTTFQKALVCLQHIVEREVVQETVSGESMEVVS